MPKGLKGYILVGGSNCHQEAGQALITEVPQIDYCFTGEADHTFAEFCKGLLSGGIPDEELAPGILSRSKTTGRPAEITTDLQSLRRQIGTVLQNGRLFVGDILYNILISSPRSSVEDAWRAARLAGIDEDIRRMPMGMKTLISEGGSGLSGGQRQRLMIARAICGAPKILIMDETTSALDNITQKHFKTIKEGVLFI